jgi:iron complex transport system substrate-binding protein
MRLFLSLLVAVALWASAHAASVTDATGRTVTVPDHPARIIPAGPPAAVLLAALAPDLMVGFPSAVSTEARAFLAPAAAELPAIPRLTGRIDVAEDLAALHPDLILDYGDVTPRYTKAIEAVQERLNVPAILLDGRLEATPAALRQAGHLLHREDRAEALAQVAETLLALPPRPMRTVVYARGADGRLVAAPGTESSAALERVGWRVLAPEGQGWFRTAEIRQIAALDPDVIIFSDPAMQDVLKRPGPWTAVRAVRLGHAYVAPALPFGWIEEPPSINRLLGLAWLHGGQGPVAGGVLQALIYGRVLPPEALASLPASPP